MIKSDKWILRQVQENQMITNFEFACSEPGISHGLSSYGYDARVSREYKIMGNTLAHNSQNITHIDLSCPISCAAMAASFTHHVGDSCIIPPHSFVLTNTYEYFKIPANVLALVIGKSTYARCGLIVNATPIEPEWEGSITLEISNTNTVPVKITSMRGICQIIFFESDERCAVSYVDKKGKYNQQTDITMPKN